MRTTRVLTVDCGAAHVACGLFSAAAGRLVLERFGSRPVAPVEPQDEDWAAATGAALRELGGLQGLRGACVLGLPGHLTFSRLVRVPPVSARQRRQILRFEESQALPAALDEMVWSQAAVSTGADAGAVVLAAVKLRTIAALAGQLRAAGFHPVGAVPAWAVLSQALRHTHPEPAEVFALSIGARSTQLFLRGPTHCQVRTLAVGGNAVTQKIAEELGVDFARAEAVKRGWRGGWPETPTDSPEQTAAQIAVELFVRRICGEINRPPSLAPADGGRRPRVLLLAGGGSLLPGLPALLGEKLEVRAEAWQPWARVELAGALAHLPGSPEGFQAADLVGLAAWAVEREPGRVNLLPRALRRETFLRSRWRWFAGAVLVAVLGLLAAAWRCRCAANAARLQGGEADAKLAELHALEARNRGNLGRLAETNRRIAALRRLAAARSAWVVFLGELQERLAQAGDVWLEQLQLMPAVQNAAGANSSPAGDRRASHRAPGPDGAAVDLRLHLAGAVLDAANPSERNGEGSRQRIGLLLAGLRGSPSVSGVEGERFDGSQPGVLRFELTLALEPHALF